MELKFGLTEDELFEYISTLEAQYYDFFQSLYGKNMFSYFTKKHIQSSDNASAFLYVMDELYKKTIEAMNTIYNKTDDFKIAAAFEDGKPVAFARVKLSINGDKSNAIVAEVLFAPEVAESEEKASQIYDSLISLIEQNIVDFYENVVVLTFEIPFYDSLYAEAVENHGYNQSFESSKGNGYEVTSLFDKTIRGRDIILKRKKEQ